MSTAVRPAEAIPRAPGPRRAHRGWAVPAPLSSPARLHPVALALVTAAVLHLLRLTSNLGSDEGGFAMVAHWWNSPGPWLYGPQWVDRPPGLIAVFAVADHLGPYGVRLTATFFGVALVAALAWAGHLLGGRRGAAWAAWTGVALGSSPLLQAERLNGELVAAVFVSLSVAALLAAISAQPGSTAHGGRAVALAAGAGASAVAALLVKQNFGDAGAFAVVLLGLMWWRDRSARLVRVGLAFAAGAVVPAALALLWSTGHGGPSALLYAMYGFRSDASATMAGWSLAPEMRRARQLAWIAVISGVVVLLLVLAWRHHRGLRRPHPLPWAVAVALGVEVFGVVGGGNYWSHYLIGLAPMLALAAGRSAAGSERVLHPVKIVVAASALLTVVLGLLAGVTGAGESHSAQDIGRFVADAARPGDTIAVPFTHANVVGASGLLPGYPYSWSLPVRTLDPHLRLFIHRLESPDGPTWVVPYQPFTTWGLDPHGRAEAALQRHYHPVARLAGRTIWLRDGLHRPLPGGRP